MNYYEILSEQVESVVLFKLGPYSSLQDIRSNYRKLVQYYHPDKYAGHPLRRLAEERVRMLNEAYHVLEDPYRRKAYNDTCTGRTGAARPQEKPVQPRPVTDRSFIEFFDAEPGTVRETGFTVSNTGGPYTKIRIVKPADARIKIVRCASMTEIDELPLRVDLEITAGGYGAVVEENLRIFLDAEETTVRIRLESRAEPKRSNAYAGYSGYTGANSGRSDNYSGAYKKGRRAKGRIPGWAVALIVVAAVVLTCYLVNFALTGMAVGNIR